MIDGEKILVAESGEEQIDLYLNKANRHGLIAGATGTGKTITLKVLAESFSDAGVPVFFADVKGDLAGMCRPGVENENITSRLDMFGIDREVFQLHAYPVTFWDIFAKKGMPLRTTITEMGPTLLAQLLELTKTQEDILNIVFRIADDEGLLLIDSKDLRSMIGYVAEHAKEYSVNYGNLNTASLNVIQRGIVSLESQGADVFFGEPALNILDWIRQDPSGKGYMNILDSQSLINSPKMYTTFMLWMLSELFERLPEVGDLDRPRMVFFFDEAHLLFTDAPKSLVQKIEQVVKLIRSKGVGVYFVTQNPRDIPDSVLGQLGNRVQHALRAYTPAEQKALKAVAEAFRINPELDTLTALQELGTGEALISFIQEDGTPGIVKRAKVLPPQSMMGAISDQEREQEIQKNFLYVQYGTYVDRDSAYEFLQRKQLQVNHEEETLAAQKQAEKEEEAARKQTEREEEAARKKAEREEEAARKKAEKEEEAARKKAEREEEAARKKAEKEEEAARKKAEKEKAAQDKKRTAAISNTAKTAAGTVGREIGKSIGKSVGGNFGKTLGGNIGASIGRGLLGTLFGK